MNKITLMDIMESLNSDNTDDAAAALHEWFVDAARNVHNRLTNPVAESEIAEAGESPDLNQVHGYENIIPEVNISGDFASMVYEVTSHNGETVAIDMDTSVPFYQTEETAASALEAAFADEGSSISNAEIQAYASAIAAHIDMVREHIDNSVEEARIDELSFDTMKTYAKKARKDRDHPTADDEKVGRRVAGLNMVADKARREKAALQYEGEQLGEVSSDLNQVHGYENIVPEVNSSGDYASMVYEVTSQSGITVAIDMDTSIPFYKISEVAKNSLAEAFDRAGAEISDQECSLYAEAIVNHVGQVIEYLDTVEESADALIAELHEAFKGLETISDKLQNVEGAQVGEEGKVSVNTKATLPSHKGKDRLGGDPVEVKGKGHTGHALEKAPKVADVKVKNTVQNGKEELKKVADKGNTSALLNKKDGKENTQSPISGKGAKGLKK